MSKSKLFIFLSFLLLFGGCASMQTKPISVDQVVEMSKSGTPSDTIIQTLKQSGTIYKLSSSEIVKLHKQGVPAPVLDYMQSTYVEAVRRRKRRVHTFMRLRRIGMGDAIITPAGVGDRDKESQVTKRLFNISSG